MKGLLGSNGLLNSNYMEQEAALNSLSTLMSIIPGDTYAQFAKVGYILFLCSSCYVLDEDSGSYHMSHFCSTSMISQIV